MGLIDYLGTHISKLLAISPFSEWEVTRSTDQELAEDVFYEFEGHGVDVICDQKERIKTIFLRRGDGEVLSEIAFSHSRREVMEHYGNPSTSGVGEQGAWDRFSLQDASIHFQFRRDCDEIEMITLIRRDAVPGKPA